MSKKPQKLSVVGLGYVGLPMAVALSKKFSVIGFDTNEERIRLLRDGIDLTREVSQEELCRSGMCFTSQPDDLRDRDIHIVAVPTPIDHARQPDMRHLIQASEMVGKIMKPGCVVVYESTVYPGATEEVCLPVLERASGLKGGKDFHTGYSPERINPADRVHRFESIVKVVAGDTPEITERLAEVYGSVVQAGVHKASSIRVAEAAKVIENTQRDLNIALINELAIIFDRLGIRTSEVLEAAKTKWNFLDFSPGLVGGHCIGVDPYYLTYRARIAGVHPEVILAGRRTNDSMGKFVAEKTVKSLIHHGLAVKGSRVALFGITFKENCGDLRNSRVLDIQTELTSYGVEVLLCDPLADPGETKKVFGSLLCDPQALSDLDGIILTVPHTSYREAPPSRWMELLKRPGVFMDVKSVYQPQQFPDNNIFYWQL